MSQRYSTLAQITPANVKNLDLQWMFQARSLEKFEATPLVVDGVMYTVQAPNDVVALDAVTGRVFWTYSYTPAKEARPCCGRVNRGVAISGRHAVHGHHRRPPDRAGRQERQAAVEHRSRQARGRLCDHARAARHQGQSDRGRGGRRIRHSRLHRGVRRQDRRRSAGASTPSPAKASPATKPGKAIRGSTAAVPSG